MTTPSAAGRENQRRRTRKDLLEAAARLLKQGRAPDMDEVAAEAMVSRATAYRYFPTIEALLVEAPIDSEVPDAQAVFAEDRTRDAVPRLDKAESMLHDMCYANANQLRIMLASSLRQCTRHDGTPIRQNRRTALIEAALEPAREQFTGAAYTNLCAALALVFGTESMIVFTDVLGVPPKTARRIKSWAIAALVRAAEVESNPPQAARGPQRRG